MNEIGIYSTVEPCMSRRSSTETVYTIQGQETDFVRDTTDTDWSSDGERDVEYEPVSEPDDDGPISDQSSELSDTNQIITTKVVEVSVGDDGGLQFADSEQTKSDDSDSELDLHDYWLCAHCRAHNNNPLYRYCEKCFKVRKNFFPPRPKRKRKVKGSSAISEPAQIMLADSGVESMVNSQESAQSDKAGSQCSQGDDDVSIKNVLTRSYLKRRAESVDRNCKRIKTDNSDSETDYESETDVVVIPLFKAASDPGITIEDVKLPDSGKKSQAADNLCITCFSEPKSGAFIHGQIAHICCCYKCAVKVWSKAKRCPVCNRKVSNVLKAIIM